MHKMFKSRFWKKAKFKTGYFYSSRTTLFGLALFLPLLIAYESLAIKVNNTNQHQIRNLADVLLKEFITLFGNNMPLYLGAFLIGVIVLFLLFRNKNTAPIKIPWFFMAILESGFYALFFGYIINKVVAALFVIINFIPNLQMEVMLVLGAGVYEELIFRVLFFRFTAETLLRLIGTSKMAAYSVAAIFSSVLFSYAHFLGPENPAFYPFVFRFFMGIFFCILYWARGLGIAAWTHVLYDLFILFNSH